MAKRARKPAPAAELEQPQMRYACILRDSSNRLIIGLRYDGGLDKGEAFTTIDASAKQFWEAVARYAKDSGLLPAVEKNHGSHRSAI